jgi:PAS domain S-box-containing protein
LKKNKKINSLDKNILYKTLFDSAAEGLVLVNTQGEITNVNNVLLEMFEYSIEELIGNEIELLIPINLKKIHTSHREKYMKTPKKRSMGIGLDLTGKKKSGEKFPIEISLNHLKANGKTHVMALISDISKRKKIEREQKSAEETLRLMHIVTSNQNLDTNNKIMKLLVLGCEKYNLPIGVVSKKEKNSFSTIKTTTHQKNKLIKNELLKCHTETVKNDKLYNIQLNNREFKHILSYVAIKIINEGEIFGVLCFYSLKNPLNKFSPIDKELLKMMSEWISAELYREKTKIAIQELNLNLEMKVKDRSAALVESEKLYKTISRNFPDGTISVLNKDLDYIFVEGKELFKLGVTSKMLIGTNYINRLPQSAKTLVKPALDKALNGNKHSLEIRLHNNHYFLNIVPLINSIGEYDKILIVERNITKRKKTELEILNNLKKEKHLNEMKSRFVSMASHEFRTPLSTILSSLSLINKYNELDNKEKQVKHIHRIKSSVNTLNSILNDFLSLEQLESGKKSTNIQSFNLKKCCTSCIDEMNLQTKKGQVINYVIDNSDKKVFLDKDLLKKVLFNLLSNAIKYSPEYKPIEVISKIKENRIFISVSDKGIGIPKEEQSHLFDRFFRARNSINIQGTGLGLNIVKRYLELMKGVISFESNENEGTTFNLTLPNQK